MTVTVLGLRSIRTRFATCNIIGALKLSVYITMFRYPISSMYLNCQFVMSKFVAPLLAEGPRSDIFNFGCDRMKKHIRNGRNPESIQVNIIS